MASRPAGPTRPSNDTSSDPPPLYSETAGPIDKKHAKIVILILAGILAVMFILAFAFCLAGGVRYQQPRYFLLLINIILSTAVTGLLIFWFYRGALSTTMMWYVFVQCTFLFFQCVTTDIFAWYEHETEKGHTMDTPIPVPVPSLSVNSTNTTGMLQTPTF